MVMLTEHELDGPAIAVGLGSTLGTDRLRDVIPQLGMRLKVHHSLRTLCTDWQVCLVFLHGGLFAYHLLSVSGYRSYESTNSFVLS